jgi:hypothetical protein
MAWVKNEVNALPDRQIAFGFGSARHHLELLLSYLCKNTA